MSAIKRVSSFSTSKVLGNPMFSQLSQALSQDDGKKTVMYFVLPPGSTEESMRDTSLGEMYRVAEAHFLNIKWVNDEKCTDEVLEGDGNIFVFDPFGGAGFERWTNKMKETPYRVELLGPQVLRYVFNCQSVLTFQTRSYPTYTLAMRNMIISLSAIPDKGEREELEKLIRYMNGTVSRSLTKAVTHVVTTTTISKKCLEANKEEIPLMTVDWVKEVWKDNQTNAVDASDSRYVKYICPIFYNVRVSMSQITANKKATLKAGIERMGGTVSADLVKGKTDVLIVNKAEGDKFKHAHKWGVICVTPEWVENSSERGLLLPVDEYIVQPAAARSHFASTPAHSMAHPPDFDFTRCSGIFDQNATRDVVNETNNMTMTRTQLQVDTQENVIAQLKSATTLDYLDGCKVYLVESEKSAELKKLLNTAGAVRHNNLVDGVTHVIVPGPKLPKVVQNKIEELNPSPYIVTLEWLVESAKQGGPADEDQYKFEAGGDTFVAPPPKPAVNQPQATTSHLASATATGIRTDEPSVSVTDNIQAVNATSSKSSTRTSGTSKTGGTYDGSGPEVQEVDDDSDTTADGDHDEEEDHEFGTHNGYSEKDDNEPDLDPIRSGLLDGISFKIMISDPEEKESVKELVRENGGSLRKLNPTVVILDPICSRKQKNGGEKAHTKYWLFECVDNQNMDLDRCIHHCPMTSFENMEKIFEGVVVAVSQYNFVEREFLVELVRALGGIYQDVMCRKDSPKDNRKRTTHLICKTMETDKAKAAKKWGIPVTIGEWITDSFEEKARLEEARYDPAALSSCTDDRTVFMPTPQRRKRQNDKSAARGNSHDATSSSVYPPSVQKSGPTKFLKNKGTPDNEQEHSAPQKSPPPNNKIDKPRSDNDLRTPPPQGPSSSSKQGSSPCLRKNDDDDIEIPTDGNGEVNSDSMLEIRRKRAVMKANLPYTDEEFEQLKQNLIDRGVDLDNVSPFTSFEERRIMEPDSPLIIGMTRQESRTFKEQAEIFLNRTPLYPTVKVAKADSTPMSEIAKRFNELQRQLAPSPITFSSPKGSPKNTSTPKSADAQEMRKRAAINRYSMGNSMTDRSLRDESDHDLDPNEVEVAPLGIKKLSSGKRPSDGSPEDKHDSKRSRQDSSDETTDMEEIPDSERPKSISPNENASPKRASGSTSGTPASTKGKRMQALTNLIQDSGPLKVSNVSPAKRPSGDPAHVLIEPDEQVEEEIEKPHLSIVSDHEEVHLKGTRSTGKKGPGRPRRVETDDEGETEGRTRAGRSRSRKPPSEVSAPRVTRRTRSQSKTRGEDTAPVGHKPIKVQRGKKNNSTWPVDLPERPLFMVSSLKLEDKAKFAQYIEQLGGRISQSPTFDTSSDAMITGSLVRSEKILGCIASGKFILRPEYIERSRESGQFLPIDKEFMWHEENVNLDKEKELARANFCWCTAQLKDNSKKPMSGMRFFLIEPVKEKESAYKRLIFAAGGEVVNSMKDATVIIKDEKSAAQTLPGIEVKNAMVLNHLILRLPTD